MKMNLLGYLLSLLLLSQVILSTSSEDPNEDLDLSVEDEVQEPEPEQEHPHQGSQKKQYYDDDEFDDPVLLHQQQQGAHSTQGSHSQSARKPHKEASQPINDSASFPNDTIENDGQSKWALLTHYEIIMIVVLIIFIINAVFGKVRNERLANKWFKQNKQFFEEQYAHIGAEREYNPKTTTSPIIKDSYNSFKFYASGRVFLNWLLVNMEFKKRQDLISVLTSMFLFNEKDKITYEASLLPSNEIPVVFSICKKANAKTMKKNYSDLDFFTEVSNPSFMNTSLVLLSESSEFTEQIFRDKNLMSLYTKIEPYIDTIFFTDKKSYTKELHAIYLSFDVTSNKSAVLMSEITLFCHMLIDTLCSLKVTGTYKKDAEARRAKYDLIKSRELAEKNAEEVKAKKEEIKSNKPSKTLTREQAQKLEEKEKKEQLKNQRKRMMKVVKN